MCQLKVKWIPNCFSHEWNKKGQKSIKEKKDPSAIKKLEEGKEWKSKRMEFVCNFWDTTNHTIFSFPWETLMIPSPEISFFITVSVSLSKFLNLIHLRRWRNSNSEGWRSENIDKTLFMAIHSRDLDFGNFSA